MLPAMAAFTAALSMAGWQLRPTVSWMVFVFVLAVLSTAKEGGAEYEPVNIVPITEMSEFQEQVEDIVNSSDYGRAASYYPVVQFHVSWCEHCKAAMPELDKAASQIMDSAHDRGGVPPKFFSVQCDKVSRAITRLCDKHVGTHFPSLVVFREHRIYHFTNRPRTQAVFHFWINRVTRPFVMGVSSVNQVQRWKEPSFILKAKPDDNDKIEMWAKLAAKQEYLEDYAFTFIDSTGDLADDAEVLMWAPPAAGLSPLPFTGDFDDEDAYSKLEAWVDTNRFPIIGSFGNSLELHKYQESKRKIVILVHGGGKSGKQSRDTFGAFAKAERPSCSYIFVTVDASEEKAQAMLEEVFPLLAPALASYPQVFGMIGKTYFEDPALNVNDLRVDALEALFADPEARQDTSWLDWAKAKKKIYMRFAKKNVANSILSVAMPILVLAIAYTIGKMVVESLSSTDDESEKQEKGNENAKAKKKSKNA